jgi:Patatin-like phospholipase
MAVTAAEQACPARRGRHLRLREGIVDGPSGVRFPETGGRAEAPSLPLSQGRAHQYQLHPHPPAPDRRSVMADSAVVVGPGGAAEWPDRPLLIPSVDAETGEPVIWDRHGAASLPQAVAASTAFPATAPPITIDGRRYIDGALRAGTNADLAGDARVVIVAEPMAHVYGTSSTAGGAEAVVRLVPDADAIEAFGPDITDLTAWVPAYQAGVRQAPSAAERIRACSAAI